MPDALRQDISDKATSALKPDSQKSTLESVGDRLKKTGNSVAGTIQPEEFKSTTQKTTDSAESYTGQAKDALGLGDSEK